MRKKELQQRLVTLTVQTQAMSETIARLQLDVHTLKSQKKLEQMGQLNVSSHHKW
jgi:hypothetical protein